MKQALALILLAFCSTIVNAAEDEISRLYLSEIMFHRMQDHNFDAITQYLNTTEKNELELNANNQAYIASIYLNYDLHSQVTSMLDYLIKNDSPLIRDTSWYYLGKLHYKNKRIKSAVDTFSKIKGKLSPEEQEIKHIMYGVMAMNDGRYDTALDELKKVSATSGFAPFVNYNIAIARMKKDNNTVVLAETLTKLAAEQKNETAQSFVFADQIYTTLGYVLLQNKEFEKAKEHFRKVTLDGHLATRALQGMIYTLSEQQEYSRALNLSLQLIKMTIGNEAIHQAYIVIPYLLQRLDDTEKAMAFYQHAVEYFAQQRVELKNYLNKIRRGEFDQYLLDIEKIMNVNEWVEDDEMARLFRFVSTLDEWRDAVYKYNEMKYLQKRLDDSFYELVIIEADVQKENRQRYKQSLDDIASSKKRVQTSLKWHQQYARNFVEKALNNQYDDVTDYLGQARFALAQFYDREEQREKQLEIEKLRQQQEQENQAESKTSQQQLTEQKEVKQPVTKPAEKAQPETEKKTVKGNQK